MAANKVNQGNASENINYDLIEGCKRGEQRAQFQIYKLYYKAMYNVSLRIVGNPMEAEDVMQESFLAAFEQISGWSGEVSFGSWLKKIVRNRSIDYWRKTRNVVVESVESIPEVAFSSYQDHGMEADPDGRINRIYEALKHLSKKCSEVFSLFFLEGYDHEEIGEIMSISVNTSRSQLSRARRRITSEIKGK
jgi:RNA polymerase sigma-70 factor (ECF subfamily)